MELSSVGNESIEPDTVVIAVISEDVESVPYHLNHYLDIPNLLRKGQVREWIDQH